jgi:hypothetical protein
MIEAIFHQFHIERRTRPGGNMASDTPAIMRNTAHGGH